MSTRSTIHFQDGGYTAAIIYRHCDGYPDGNCGVLADLERFFDDVETQTKDTRFFQASYLAAKYVVWQADQNAYRSDFVGGEWVKRKLNMLDFLSVGVVLDDPGDIEYRYTVHCVDHAHRANRPRVTWEAIGGY